MYIPLKINLGSRNKLPDGRYELSKGTKIYIKNGDKHRDNGPAEIRTDGYQAWFKNGLKHRDGNKPAVINADGSEEFWVKGIQIKSINKKGK